MSCRQKGQKESRVEYLPYYNEASFTAVWLDPKSDQLKDFHRIPDFSLKNQNNQTVNQNTVANSIYVADFFFTTCPGICPKMTTNMMRLQKEFLEDDEVLLLSHSVTPVADSVPVLKDYAEKKGIDSRRWHLLTGERQEIYSLGRKAYFIEEDFKEEKDADAFLHTENFVLVDKNGHLRGIYNGLNKTSIQQLIADIYTLKKED